MYLRIRNLRRDLGKSKLKRNGEDERGLFLVGLVGRELQQFSGLALQGGAELIDGRQADSRRVLGWSRLFSKARHPMG